MHAKAHNSHWPSPYRVAKARRKNEGNNSIPHVTEVRLDEFFSVSMNLSRFTVLLVLLLHEIPSICRQLLLPRCSFNFQFVSSLVHGTLCIIITELGQRNANWDHRFATAAAVATTVDKFKITLCQTAVAKLFRSHDNAQLYYVLR